jgi:hypothetical protein
LGQEFELFGIPKKSRDAAAASRAGAENLPVLAQPGKALTSDNNIENDSLGRALIPRPLPIGGKSSLFFEPYLTKVTLYQAELPRQPNGQSSQ